jgi:hypothetical protein
MKVFVLIVVGMFLMPTVSVSGGATDYGDYFAGILKAEVKIAEKDLPGAMQLYNTLFDQWDFVFARDAYNAMQVAVLSGNAAQADKLLSRCARSGVPKEVLMRNAIIKKGYAAKSKQFDKLYSAGEAAYLKIIDRRLREEFQERFRREQASKGQRNYREIVLDNFNCIAALAKEGRFPGEQLIGVDERLTNDIVFATLLHYPYAYVALYKYLWDALKKGEVQPRTLIYLYGFNQTRTSILYTDDMPVDTKHFTACYNMGFGIRSGNTSAVNSARAGVYMHSVEMEQSVKAAAREYGMDYREGY